MARRSLALCGRFIHHVCQVISARDPFRPPKGSLEWLALAPSGLSVQGQISLPGAFVFLFCAWWDLTGARTGERPAQEYSLQ